MRKRLYEIIDTSTVEDKLGNFYNVFMMAVIVISLIPLAFKTDNIAFQIIDKVAVIIFIIDYLIRLITADYKLKKRGFSFILYPFTPMAIIDAPHHGKQLHAFQNSIPE